MILAPGELEVIRRSLVIPTCWNPRVRGEALALFEAAIAEQQSLVAESA